MAKSQNWQQLGSGCPFGAYSFYLDSSNNSLYALGNFVNPSTGDTVYSPGCWNGSDWIPIGNFDFTGIGNLCAITKFRDTIYISGYFTKQNGAPGDCILKLNGIQWDSLQYSEITTIFSLGEFNNQLYLGGQFYNFGPFQSYSLIIYSPQLWATVPPLILGRVQKMTVYNNQLVVAGSYTADISITYEGNILAWDGFSFITLDNGLELYEVPYPMIYDVEVYQNKLYAAGMFLSLNVSGGNRIVSWDGSTWSGVGGGLNFDASSLQVYNGNLYVSGSFQIAGGVSADHIAKWNGSQWCGLGSTFNGTIYDMCVYNSELIISGSFTTIDGQPINHMAKWIGGNYVDSCSTVNVPELSMDDKIFVYPTPVISVLTILSEKLPIKSVQIRNVFAENMYSQSFSSEKVNFDVSFLQSGTYFLMIDLGKNVVNKKFIKY